MTYAIRVDGSVPIDLAKIEPRVDGGLIKKGAQDQLHSLTAELGELQELLFAAGTHSLLIVLQGMDTSGKDGTVRSVLSEINPVGCRVTSFKVPTELELAHDFLWRIHQQTPEKGMIGVFNRSHYEDVLVARVRDLVPKSVWNARYAAINDFERLLTNNGTILTKIFLHISSDEQEARLRAREEDVSKAWKLSAGDWETREQWPAFMEAYQEAINRCSSKNAPWWIVPADRKWFRNLAVAELLVRQIRPYRERWIATLKKRGDEELAAINEARIRSLS